MEMLRVDRIPEEPTVATVGTFDGVHIGHQAVLEETCRLAGGSGRASVVCLLDSRPTGEVGASGFQLTSLQQRLELIQAIGLDYCYVMSGGERRPPAELDELVDYVLAGTVHAHTVVVGSNFCFGAGTDDELVGLERLAAPRGIRVATVAAVEAPGLSAPVSSSAVRDALAAGDVVFAAEMLGRLHEVQGIVEHGDHRGGDIGFPTANVVVPPAIMLPGDGVYAGWYGRPDGTTWPAAINVGRRPTFYDDGAPRLLEAHLLDFEGNLYGELARVRFDRWLRPEERFASVDELVSQMNQDVQQTRDLAGFSE